MHYVTRLDDISVLPLSVRSRNCLRNANILTIGAMMDYPSDQFINIRSMGVRSVSEILGFIQELEAGSGEYILVDSIEQANSETAVVRELIGADGTVNILIDPSGMIVQDVPVDKLLLSNRAKNSLTRGGYSFASQLIGITYEELMNIQNMGAKTAQEVLAYSERFSVELDSGELQLAVNTSWCDLVSEMHDAYGKTACAWLRELLAAKNQSPEIIDNLLIRRIYERAAAHDALKELVLHSVEKNGGEISRASLEENVPQHLKRTTILGKILLELETDAFVTINAGMICRRFLSVVEFAASIENDRIREIIQGRIAGKTLQEIGDQYDITREGVRQLMQKGLETKPYLKEDKYVYLYDNYDFSLEDFMLAFDEPAETYYYLDMISQVFRGKKKPLDDILTDTKIAPEYRKKAERAIYKQYIAVDSVWVKVARDSLTKHYIKTRCKTPTKIEDFVTKYHSWLETIGLGEQPSLMIDSGTYANKLNDKCDYVLWHYGDMFRYYNIPEYDFEELLTTLDLEQFANTKFSTLKLFRDYPVLMKQYDIWDEYELHNLLKKIWVSKTVCVKFTRMPTIEVGTANVDDQVLALLLQYAPISADDLANRYEDEYGVIARTVRGSYLRNFDPYFYKGVYSVDYAALPAVQFNRMKAVLDRSFYTMQEVSNLYKQEFPHSDEALLNPYTLKTLGFHVYPGYSGYIVSNAYAGATDYFNTILTQEDEVDMREHNSAIRSIATYDSELRRLRSKFQIVEYMPLRYINIRKLNQLGVTAERLEKYCTDVSERCEVGDYFTVSSLRKGGFIHDLDELGFEEWFYSSVLLEDKEHFSYQRIGGTRIFLNGKDEANLGDMLVWLMKKYRKLDFHDLKELLENHYGIVLPKEKLLTIIKDTELCYDVIMDVVYVNYNSYFEEG